MVTAALAKGRADMRGRCEAIAAKYSDAVRLIDGRPVIHHECKALTGYATITAPNVNGCIRVIKAPKPVTRRALYIFLHECAHHILGHIGSPRRKPRLVEEMEEEMEAEQWAHATMRAEGLSVPRSMTKQAMLVKKIWQALRRIEVASELRKVQEDVEPAIAPPTFSSTDACPAELDILYSECVVATSRWRIQLSRLSLQIPLHLPRRFLAVARTSSMMYRMPL